MFPVRPPILIRSFYNNVVWQMPDAGKVLYLTFDDGPIPEVTPWVVEQLNAYKAKATFFCLGDNVKKYPEVYKLLLSSGHTTGNHSMNHYNGWFTQDFRYMRNVEQCQQVLDKYAETKPVDGQKLLFRPPYGKISFSQVKALKKKYRIIMWDVLSFDYDVKLSGEQCFRNVAKYAKTGSIVVFHDSIKAEQRLRYALPQVLKYFSEKGYVFKALRF